MEVGAIFRSLACFTSRQFGGGVPGEISPSEDTTEDSSEYFGNDFSYYFFAVLITASLFFFAFPIDYVSYHPHFGQ